MNDRNREKRDVSQKRTTLFFVHHSTSNQRPCVLTCKMPPISNNTRPNLINNNNNNNRPSLIRQNLVLKNVVMDLGDDDYDDDDEESLLTTRRPSEKTSLTGVRYRVLNDTPARYSWRKFSPNKNKHPLEFLGWLVRGFSNGVTLSDSEVEENFRKLARMLLLLREYEARFGLPENGGSKDQHYVLQELCCQLYAGGTPIWSLQPVMERAAFGLTGAKGVNFCLLPRFAFIFAPTSGATTMFRMERGFHMHKTTLLERVLVRIASFGTNTETVHSLPSHLPHPDLFSKPPRGKSAKWKKPREVLAQQILDLASEGTGLFFYTHTKWQDYTTSSLMVDTFWEVEDSIKELFTRLATIEAEMTIDAASEQLGSHDKMFYPTWAVLGARVIAAMGATGLWFGGSWYDMIAAGVLAFFVALAQGSAVWKHERFIFEVIISLMVGLSAGIISQTFPNRTCFGAMAVGSIVDILQGFKIVYAIMELMSRHTLAGGADFLEAFLFTGLIASFLKFGQVIATSIMGGEEAIDLAATQCKLPIGEYWYFVLLPISTVMWAYSFMPQRSDLASMALHGILSYSVYYGMDKATGHLTLSTFVAALSVTFSAGIVSRFTGRQALGDTVTGLYALVPGAYLARGLFAAAASNSMSPDLLYNIIANSVVIGLGAWSGTILCSPTILGTNRGLINQSRSSHNRRDLRHSATMEASPMLFF
jgi:uncharacterized membrane protein YjjP (DUF1212 family)